MELSNNYLLNRFFTKNTLRSCIDDLVDETFTNTVDKYIVKPFNKKNYELIMEIYQKLDQEYRNEYYYKNTLLNKLLLGVHSLNTTTALSEVPVHKSKADFILINGKAVVYEIKTDLDNFDRLKTQIDDYYKAFKYVSVVTSESNYDAIMKMLSDTKVGICILTRKNTVSVKKKPIESRTKLDSSVIFKILRKAEYENILQQHYGYLPNVSQFEYYKACKLMFESIDSEISHHLFIQELKKRKRINETDFKKVPREIKSLVYFSELKDNEYVKLNQFLTKTYGG